MKLSLLVASGIHEGEVLQMNGVRLLIGRGPDCHIRPNSPEVGLQHCGLVLRGDSAFLRDLGSRTGTVLNGRRLRGEIELQDGDLIQIGPLSFGVMLEGNIEEVSAEPPSLLARSETAAPQATDDLPPDYRQLEGLESTDCQPSYREPLVHHAPETQEMPALLPLDDEPEQTWPGTGGQPVAPSFPACGPAFPPEVAPSAEGPDYSQEGAILPAYEALEMPAPSANRIAGNGHAAPRRAATRTTMLAPAAGRGPSTPPVSPAIRRSAAPEPLHHLVAETQQIPVVEAYPIPLDETQESGLTMDGEQPLPVSSAIPMGSPTHPARQTYVAQTTTVNAAPNHGGTVPRRTPGRSTMPAPAPSAGPRPQVPPVIHRRPPVQEPLVHLGAETQEIPALEAYPIPLAEIQESGVTAGAEQPPALRPQPRIVRPGKSSPRVVWANGQGRAPT